MGFIANLVKKVMTKPLVYWVATRTHTKDENGLENINLDGYQGKNYLGRLTVTSGQPYAQNFRDVPHELRGHMEPCPEGEYDLGPIEWAGGKGNYSAQFSDIESPIRQVIYWAREILFHLDGNRKQAPGSAGCLVFKDMNDLKKFVNLSNGYGPFTKLYVNWGLKHVTLPSVYPGLPK